jgi:hypothetical protein
MKPNKGSDETMKTTLKTVRFSYAHVFEPRGFDGNTPKYSASLLIDKSDEALVKRIKEALQVAIDEGIPKKWGGKKPAKLDICLRDGDTERPEDPNYAGKYYINASNVKQPTVLNQYAKPATQDEFYSGCYGVAVVDFYPHSHKNMKHGVYAQLLAVMKTEDGESFGASGIDLSELAQFAVKPSDTALDFL